MADWGETESGREGRSPPSVGRSDGEYGLERAHVPAPLGFRMVKVWGSSHRLSRCSLTILSFFAGLDPFQEFYRSGFGRTVCVFVYAQWTAETKRFKILIKGKLGMDPSLSLCYCTSGSRPGQSRCDLPTNGRATRTPFPMCKLTKD